MLKFGSLLDPFHLLKMCKITNFTEKMQYMLYNSSP
jgi:hypothetical protein